MGHPSDARGGLLNGPKPPPPASRRRRVLGHVRRWAIRLAWALAALVTLVLALLMAVLFTSVGTRIALHRGAAMYDEMIPGSITLGPTEGALGTRLRLTELRTADRTGERLADVDELELELNLRALVTGKIHIRRLGIVGLRANADGAWGDLGPPSGDEPAEEPPSEGLGPSLPALALDDLELAAVEVWMTSTDAPLVVLPALRVTAMAEGHDAEVHLELQATLPSSDLEIARLGLDATWHDPVAEVVALRLDTNLAEVTIRNAVVDLASLQGSLGGLEVKVGAAQVAALVPAMPVPMDFDLQAHGEDNRLTLELLGKGTDGTQLAVLADALLEPPSSLTGSIRLDCAPCLSTGQSIHLKVEGAGELDIPTGKADVELDVGALHVDASASLHPDQRIDARLRWRDHDLHELEPWLALADLEVPLRGDTEGELKCAGTLEPRDLACDITAEVRESPPVTSAVVRAGVHLDEGIHIELRELTSSISSLEIRLDPSPARIDIVGPAIEIQGLSLVEQGGGGRLTADASIRDGVPIRAAVRVRDLQLDGLDAWVPDLRLAGSVDAFVDATTEDGFVTAKTDVTGRNLAWKGHALGRLGLHAELSRDGVVAQARAETSVGKVGIEASGPLALRTSGPILSNDRPIRAAVDVTDVDLERLRQFVPTLEAHGRVEAHVRLEGTLAAPRATLALEGRDLAWAETALGDLDVDIRQGAGEVILRAHVRHPVSDQLHVSVKAPLSVDLAASKIHWDPERSHQASLVLSNVDLAEVGTIANVEDLAGWVDAELLVQGPLTDPRAIFRMQAGDLRFQDHTLGSVRSVTDLSDGMATFEADVHASWVQHLALAARVPLRIDAASGRVDWDVDAPHVFDLDIVDADLEALEDWVQDAKALGLLSLRATGRGTASVPEIALALQSDRIEVASIPIEDLDLRVDVHRDTTRVDLSLHRGAAELVTQALVPLRLDLPGGTAEWRRHEPHEWIATLQGLDRASLVPIVELSDDIELRFDSEVRAHGNLDAYTIGWTADGDIRPAGQTPFSIRGAANVSPSQQTANLSVGHSKRALLGLHVDTELDLAKAQVDGVSPTSVVRGVLEMNDIDLSIFADLLPPSLAELEGTLGGRVDVDGTLETPNLQGRLALADGAVTPVLLRQRLRDINVQADFDSDSVRLTELRLLSDRGSLQGRGSTRIDGSGIHSEIALDFDKFPIRVPPAPTSEFTSHIETRLEVLGSGTSVEVELSDTVLEVLTLSSSGAVAIPTSEAVVYVDAPPPEPEAIDTDPASPIHIALKLDSPLLVTGPAISMTWTGRLEAHLAEAVGIDGEFKTTPGASTFELLGSTFAVNRGVITLSEDAGLEPFLDIEAQTTVGSTKITALIQGRASRPELRFSSVPPRSETEIISILLSGTDDAQTDADSSVAQAASALAAFSSPALSKAGQRLGVDTVRLSFGDSLDEPIASFGKRLGKRVYGEATFRGNPPIDENRSEILIRYRFLPRWVWDTLYGDRQIGETGLWWIKSFDKRLELLKDAKKALEGQRSERRERRRERAQKTKDSP